MINHTGLCTGYLNCVLCVEPVTELQIGRLQWQAGWLGMLKMHMYIHALGRIHTSYL